MSFSNMQLAKICYHKNYESVKTCHFSNTQLIKNMSSQSLS